MYSIYGVTSCTTTKCVPVSHQDLMCHADTEANVSAINFKVIRKNSLIHIQDSDVKMGQILYPKNVFDDIFNAVRLFSFLHLTPSINIFTICTNDSKKERKRILGTTTVKTQPPHTAKR